MKKISPFTVVGSVLQQTEQALLEFSGFGGGKLKTLSNNHEFLGAEPSRFFENGWGLKEGRKLLSRRSSLPIILCDQKRQGNCIITTKFCGELVASREKKKEKNTYFPLNNFLWLHPVIENTSIFNSFYDIFLVFRSLNNKVQVLIAA